MFSQSQTVARLCLGTLQLCKTLPTLGPVVRFFAATRLDILSNPPLLHQANWLLRTASHRCLLTYPVFRSQKSSKLSFNWNNSELLHPARRRLPIHLVESIRNISGGSKGNITKIDSKIVMLTSKKKGQAKKKRALADSEDREVIAYATADEYDLEGMNKGFKELGLYVRSPHHVPGMAHTSAHPDSGADLEGFDPSIDGGKGVKGYSHSSSQANEMQDVIPDISEVLHVLGLYKINPEERQIYFFRDGAVVFWNVSELERINVLTYISRYALGATVSKETVEEQSESFPYMYSEGKTRLANDCILLSDSGPTHLERYTFSNALALSVKLGVWESELDYYIDSIENVTEEMKSGRVILKNKEVLAHLGQLYSLRHSLKMSSGLLDTPDYYWERKNLEQIYERTTTNLSINRRMQVMSDKLNNCLEMMSVLKDYHAVVHGHRLEVIIIVLIVVEVIFEAAHFLSKEDNEDRRSVTDTKTAASITQNEVSTSV